MHEIIETNTFTRDVCVCYNEVTNNHKKLSNFLIISNCFMDSHFLAKAVPSYKQSLVLHSMWQFAYVLDHNSFPASVSCPVAVSSSELTGKLNWLPPTALSYLHLCRWKHLFPEAEKLHFETC